MINRPLTTSDESTPTLPAQPAWRRGEAGSNGNQQGWKVLLMSHVDCNLRRALAHVLMSSPFGFDVVFTDPFSGTRPWQGRADAILLVLDSTANGALQTCRRLHEQAPEIPIVAIATSRDEASAVDAVSHGAQDCLMHDGTLAVALPLTVRLAIERTRRHQSRAVAHQNQDSSTDPQAVARFARLTSRQREISELLIRGKSIKQIAAQLDIGVQAATKHRAGILRKCEVDSVVHLVRLTLAAGLPIG
jgi:DNA-binding NarL/FixJ family response regulator